MGVSVQTDLHLLAATPANPATVPSIPKPRQHGPLERFVFKHSSFYMIFIADHGRELFRVSWKHGKALEFPIQQILLMQTGIRLG